MWCGRTVRDVLIDHTPFVHLLGLPVMEWARDRTIRPHEVLVRRKVDGR
jgi:hypothetical protein